MIKFLIGVMVGVISTAIYVHYDQQQQLKPKFDVAQFLYCASQKDFKGKEKYCG